MTKEHIEIIRQTLIPFVKKELLKINYEGLGKSDAKEFEKDLNEILDLAIKALDQQTSEDCVSRQAAIDYLYTNMAWYNENGSIADDSQKLRDITNLVNGIPPVTPTHKVGKWIRKPIRNYKGGCIGAEMICSCCNKDNRHDEYMDYCPNCGCRMTKED